MANALQEHKFNAFHLSMTYLNQQVAIQKKQHHCSTELPSMCNFLKKRHTPWLGHLVRTDGGTIPNDLYGERTQGPLVVQPCATGLDYLTHLSQGVTWRPPGINTKLMGGRGERANILEIGSQRPSLQLWRVNCPATGNQERKKKRTKRLLFTIIHHDSKRTDSLTSDFFNSSGCRKK